MLETNDFLGTVVVFSRIDCINSLKAKMLLHDLDINYVDVSLDKEKEALKELEKFVSGKITTPHIFFNERHIEGYQALLELTKNEKEFESIVELIKMNEAPDMAPHFPISNQKILQQKNKTDKNANNDNELDMKKNHKEWIPTEYDKLVSMMRKANLIKDNRVSVTKTYRNSFKGEDFISWIIKTKKIKRSEALELGQELIEQHFNEQSSKDGTVVFDPEMYYQIVDEGESGPLNCGRPPTGDFTRNVGEFNDLLQQLIEPIYDHVLTPDRTCVYIDRLEDNSDFKHYIALMREAVNLDLENSTIEERLAFFTNCYNMQLLHITFKCGIPQTIWQRRRYHYSIYYKIGEHFYSLQSILNGILRGNKKGYRMLWKPFGKEDKRRPFIIPDGEPLVLFAINMYIVSTSPIRAYSSKNVLDELHKQAQELIDSDAVLRVDCKKQTIQLSRLFKIYASDFGPTTEAVIEWIIDTMKPGPKREDLIKLYYTANYTVSYLSFDYSLNIIREDVPQLF